jgi:ribonuclease VapC
MNKIVLDASAMLALLNQEAGWEIVEQHLPQSIMSTVNLSEVMTVLINIGAPLKEAEMAVTELVKEIIVFDQQQACIAANLRKSTKLYGLSLGDRVCLALAQVKNVSVLTADKSWGKLKHPVKICFIR